MRRFGTMVKLNNKWDEFLKVEAAQDYYKNLRDFLLEEYHTQTIYPRAGDVFSVYHVKPEDIKVVIIGQDPYIHDKQAIGRSFAVPIYQSMPPSLRNIKQELDSENILRSEWRNDLENWAEQGVFLLNRTLTVREGASLSHYGKGWEIFTLDTIRYIERECTQPIVYMLWGANARQLKGEIVQPKRLILESAHPSPLSAYRGFFGNNHFALANSFLEENGVKPIRW